MHDAQLRAGGVCAEYGPPPGPGKRRYCCSRDTGHQGAHEAVLAGHLLDSWPQAQTV